MLRVLWLLPHFVQQPTLWRFECVCCSAHLQLHTLLRHLALGHLPDQAQLTPAAANLQ